MNKILTLLIIISITYSQNIHDFNKLSFQELMNIKIESASHFEQSLSDLSSNYFYIEKQEIQKQQYTDLSDLLMDLPFVDYIDHASRFGEYYTIRGIPGNDRFLVLVNGMKINPPNGTVMSIGNSIPIFYADKVEILFGPFSSSYGADAFSGIINIVINTKKDVFSSYFLYSNYNSKDFGLNIAKKIGSLHITAISRFFSSDGINLVGRDPVYDFVKSYGPLLDNQFEQPINDYFHFFNLSYNKLEFEYHKQRFDEGNGIGISPEIHAQNREHVWAYNQQSFRLKYKYEFSSKNNIKSSLRYTRFDLDPKTQYLKFKKRDTDTLFNQYLSGKDELFEYQLHYFHQFSNNFKTLIGYQLFDLKSVPPYANDEYFKKSLQFVGRVKDILIDSMTTRETRHSLYIKSQLKIGLLTSTVGLRYDNSDYFGNILTPYLGFSYKFSEDLYLKASYGQAFQAPSLFYRFEQFAGQNNIMVSSNSGNMRLKNQELKSFDLGLDYSISKNTKVNFSIYKQTLKNLIQRRFYTDSAYNHIVNDYTAGYRNENIGKQEIFGLQVSSQHKIDKGMKFKLSYVFTNSELFTDKDSYKLPASTNHKIYFTLNGEYKSIYYRLLIKYFHEFYVNPLNPRFQNSNNTMNGYWIDDLKFSIRDFLNEKTKLFIQVNNLFNRDIKQPAQLTQNANFPEIPYDLRRIRIGLQHEF